MKTVRIGRWCLALLGAAVLLGMTGCDDLEDDDPPDNVSGAWVTTISGTSPTSGPFSYRGTMTINQNGQTIAGSYTYREGQTFSFSGTYDDGLLVAVDSDNWTMRIEFEENSAEGTLTGTYDNGTPGTEQISLAR
ncbi:MAG TPA: hypothetical protein P5204_13545 [Kiritimatiellia bacterium]|nr:hypothetical protein [Kiritimatiellia bacterium]